MILVDSSVWVDHPREGDAILVRGLNESGVLMHPFILGELACGNSRHRDRVLGLLAKLPQAAPASDREALLLIERHQLMGSGIGYIDVHLLTSAMLSNAASLWTRDKRLFGIAELLGLGCKEVVG